MADGWPDKRKYKGNNRKMTERMEEKIKVPAIFLVFAVFSNIMHNALSGLLGKEDQILFVLSFIFVLFFLLSLLSMIFFSGKKREVSKKRRLSEQSR